MWFSGNKANQGLCCVLFPKMVFFFPGATDVIVVIMVGLEVCTQTKPGIRKQKGFSFQDL